jgi:ribulose-phosphate 3-epimerase
MITPIIMESDLAEVRRKLEILRERKAGRVHLDIGDGLFSDLLTIAPADLQEFDLSEMRMDIHLLVDDPTEWVEECVVLKPARLIAQIERMGPQKLFLESVANYGVEGGLALKIETPIEEIEEEVLSTCKTILLLAIPAGTTGSPFDLRVIDKIIQLRKKYTGSILIDGAMNKETYERVIEAGASEAGANSAYWSGELGESNGVIE